MSDDTKTARTCTVRIWDGRDNGREPGEVITLKVGEIHEYYGDQFYAFSVEAIHGPDDTSTDRLDVQLLEIDRLRRELTEARRGDRQQLLWRAAVLAYLGLARAVRFTVALCRPDPAA
jgi:hypothetical protein